MCIRGWVSTPGLGPSHPVKPRRADIPAGASLGKDMPALRCLSILGLLPGVDTPGWINSALRAGVRNSCTGRDRPKPRPDRVKHRRKASLYRLCRFIYTEAFLNARRMSFIYTNLRFIYRNHPPTGRQPGFLASQPLREALRGSRIYTKWS
jgi:hypothetical protein